MSTPCSRLTADEYARWLGVLECRDNEGESYDRYTIVLGKRKHGIADPHGNYHCIAAAEEIYHPQFGFYQHCAGKPGAHLGKRIRFTQLPDVLQKAVINELEDNYNEAN